MAIVRLPKFFCQSLCSAVANFWWSSKVRTRGIHWKSWEFMCESKNKGGMGFKDFGLHNSFLLAKQAWRCLQNPNHYWASMLRGIYYEREEMWKVKPRAGISWVWRSILHGRDLIKQEGRWHVGDGTNIHISKDKWLSNEEGAKVLEGCQISSVSDLISHSACCWYELALRNSLALESVSKASKTPLSFCGGVDTLFWPHASNGDFSVKSGYKILKEKGGSTSVRPFSSFITAESTWKGLWSARIPGRIKHFIWRLNHDAIASKCNLWKRKIGKYALCPICLVEEESLERIFFFCKWTTPLWHGLQIYVPSHANAYHFDKWMEDLFSVSWCDGGEKQELIAMIFITLWYIWKARNRMHLRNTTLTLWKLL